MTGTDLGTDWEAIVLATWREGQSRSIVGPGPVGAHLTLARAVAARVGDAATGLDLGSGAGIPGLALAGLLPAMHWTLLDASRRRTGLLERAVEELAWGHRVTVRHERAEVFARQPDGAEAFDVVVARSFGPPAVTAECAAPLVRPGGRVVVTEPPDGRQGEDRWPRDGLAPLGLRRGPRYADPALQVLQASGTREARFPRQPGVAARRPLW